MCSSPVLVVKMTQSASLTMFMMLAVAGVSYFAQAEPLSAVLPDYPVRYQWVHGHGYCGELCIQQTALTHGVWVGQQQARDLGGGELLVGSPGTDLNNLEDVVNALGFDYVTWDPDRETGRVKPTAFLRWMKQQIIGGRAVNFAARLEDDEDDAWYDHIMPAYGVVYDSSTAGQFDASDTLLFHDNFGNVATKSMSDPSFYAAQYECNMPEGTRIGCIPTGAPTFATAMGGLQDANKRFLPMRLVITGWSDGTDAAKEPNVRSRTVSARYQLALKPGGNVQTGQTISVYRYDGSGSPPRNPTSGSQLIGAGCSSWSFVMGPSALTQLDDSVMGALWSNSVVYFVAMLQE